MKQLCVYLLWLGVAWGMSCPLPVRSQNNPFRINDSLYVLYNRALKYRGSYRGVLVSDTLLAEARRVGDKKAQCLALTIPMVYYLYRNDSSAMAQAVGNLQRVSKANGYLRYYYYGATNHIIWYLNQGRTLRALNLSEEMKAESLKDQSPYGIFSCIKTQGYIYFARRDFRTSIRCFQSALDFQLANMPEQDPLPLYRRIGELYREDGCYGQAYEYLEKAIRTAKVYANRMAAQVEKCRTLFEMGREDEFLRLFTQCKAEMKESGRVMESGLLILEAYACLMKGENEEAASYAAQLPDAITRYGTLRKVAERSGDYRKAYEYNCLHMGISDSIICQIRSSDLAELTVELANERTKREAKTLEAKNAALNLANTRLELDQAQADASLAKTHAENNRLTLINQTLELEQAQAEMRYKQRLLENEKAASRHRIVFYSVLLVFLAASACLLGYFLHRRKQILNVLKKKNQELARAHGQIQAAARLRDQFVHTTGRKMCPPLLTIVKASRLLVARNADLSEKKKAEYSCAILQQSELLTALFEEMFKEEVMDGKEEEGNVKA